MTTDDGILAGLKVVEFAQNAAIPHCGRLLAGMGADVVKIEPPGGDAMRALAQLAPMEAKAFALINPGKRDLVLDLQSPDAGPVVEGLFGWADVVLVAFKQLDLERYGIDYESARAVNPRIIYLAHTAFGPKGEDAHIGGYDVLVQARSGAGFIMNRAEDGVPAATRPAVNDFGTGMISALGVVAALRHRDLTGEGQKIESSLLGTAMSLATPIIGQFETDAEVLEELQEDMAAARQGEMAFADQRRMYEQRIIPGGGTFRIYFRTYLTSDSMVTVAGLSPALHTKFHEVTGLPRPDLRHPHTPEFDAIVTEAERVFRTRTTAEWLQRLRAVEYPCGPYNLPWEAVADEQIRANDYVVDIEHPAFGRYTTSGMPLSFSAAPNPTLGASPSFGQHSRELLGELGLAPDTVDRLVADGVVLDGPPENSP